MPGPDLLLVDQVSTLLNRLGSSEGWLTTVLETVTSFKTLGLQPKGCAFELEGTRMQLVAQVGQSEAFLQLHEGIGIGDCLCGAVARSGQVVTSLHCDRDCRHTIEVPGTDPHGHVVVPLRARGHVNGVLCLYVPPEQNVDESTVNALALVGEQVGLALENSQLERRLQAARLEHPMYGLATEQKLRLAGAQLVAEARRYQRPLSLISLVADRAGPEAIEGPAGAPPIVDLVEQLDRLTREVDVVACCGEPISEAVALLPETALDKAIIGAERVHTAIRSRGLHTASMGIAALGPKTQDLDALLATARQARQRAEAAGGDRLEAARET